MPKPQDDLPYEVQMKFIIHGYRQLFRKLEYIEPYTRSLEEQNEQLRNIVAKKGMANQALHRKYVEKMRLAKRYRNKVDYLTQILRENGIDIPNIEVYEDTVDDMSSEPFT
jgi:hypothetical protein